MLTFSHFVVFGQKIVNPPNAQYNWAEQEKIQFVCLDPCTWQGREYDNHTTPLSEITLPKLNTDQWCEAALLWGAKTMLFVAKHTGGFCWWQTETTDYSVKNVAWKNGKGDLLEELAKSCQKYGLGMGVYVYSGDATWGAGIGSGGKTKDPSKQEEYNQIYRQQLTEAITKASKYVPVTEVWFDGGVIAKVDDILAQYAPDAVYFGGPHLYNSVRWVGNEHGRLAPEDAWSTRDISKSKRAGDPYGQVWHPMELDATLYDHNWFWKPENEFKRKSLDELMRFYYESVGNGLVMLLNSTPTTEGLIPDGDMQRYRELGEEIERRFSAPLHSVYGTGKEFEITFDTPAKINHVIIQEDFKFGERVLDFTVDALIDGQWKELSKGSHVGRKRIIWFGEESASKIKLQILNSKANPLIKDFSAYYVENFEGMPKSAIRSNWQTCGKWDGKIIKKGRLKLKVDLTPYIDKPGNYLVELRSMDDDAQFTIGKKQLFQSGQVSPDEMLVVDDNKPNQLHIVRTAVVTDEADIKLKVDLKDCKGAGVVLIKKE
jgi:alpha-L-fucosidase